MLFKSQQRHQYYLHLSSHSYNPQSSSSSSLTLLLDKIKADFGHRSSTSHFMLNTLLNSNCRVVELGSGCGLLGMAIAAMGFPVTVSDGHPAVLERLRRNVELNQTSFKHSIQTVDLDWSGDVDIQGIITAMSSSGNDENEDNVTTLWLCSDCVYDPSGVNSALVNVIHKILQSRHNKHRHRILLGCTVRQPETLFNFIKLALTVDQCDASIVQIDFFEKTSLTAFSESSESMYCTILF